MQTNEQMEEIKKEFYEFMDLSEDLNNQIADWWLAKLQEQKQQMIEKGEELKKKTKILDNGTISVVGNTSVLGNWANPVYNQAITDYQNLIKKDI